MDLLILNLYYDDLYSMKYLQFYPLVHVFGQHINQFTQNQFVKTKIVIKAKIINENQFIISKFAIK